MINFKAAKHRVTFPYPKKNSQVLSFSFQRRGDIFRFHLRISAETPFFSLLSQVSKYSPEKKPAERHPNWLEIKAINFYSYLFLSQTSPGFMWISNTAMETWEVLKVLCNTRWKRCLPQWALLPLKYVNSGILPLWEKKGLPGTETGDIRSKSIDSSRAINHFTSKWGCLLTFAWKFMQGGKKKNQPYYFYGDTMQLQT